MNSDQKLNLIALNKNPYAARNLSIRSAQKILRDWYDGSLDDIHPEKQPVIFVDGWASIDYRGIHYNAKDLIIAPEEIGRLAVYDWKHKFSLRTPKETTITPTLTYFNDEDDDYISSCETDDSVSFFYPGDWLLECGHLLMSGSGEKNMWKVPTLSDQQTIPTLVRALSERYACDVMERKDEYVLQLPAAELEMDKRINKFSSRIIHSQVVTKFRDDCHKTEETLVSLLKDIDFKSVYCDTQQVHLPSLEDYVTSPKLKLPSTWTILTTYFNFTLDDIRTYTDRLAKLGENK